MDVYEIAIFQLSPSHFKPVEIAQRKTHNPEISCLFLCSFRVHIARSKKLTEKIDIYNFLRNN